MQDTHNLYHGPISPGPGWVEIGEGPLGGKMWRFHHEAKQPKPAPEPTRTAQDTSGDEEVVPADEGTQEGAGPELEPTEPPPEVNEVLARHQDKMKVTKFGDLPAINTVIPKYGEPISPEDHTTIADWHTALAAEFIEGGQDDLAKANIAAAKYHDRTAQVNREAEERNAKRAAEMAKWQKPKPPTPVAPPPKITKSEPVPPSTGVQAPLVSTSPTPTLTSRLTPQGLSDEQVKRHYKEWIGAVPESDIQKVGNYTADSDRYASINGFLRDLPEYRSHDHKTMAMINDTVSVMDRLISSCPPLESDTKLHRIVYDNKFIDLLQKDTTFTDLGYVSTSYGGSDTPTFTSGGDKGAADIHISVPRGTRALPASKLMLKSYPDDLDAEENELILARGSKFRITSRTLTGKNFYRIEMELLP